MARWLFLKKAKMRIIQIFDMTDRMKVDLRVSAVKNVYKRYFVYHMSEVDEMGRPTSQM